MLKKNVKKLTLNRESIGCLDQDQLQAVAGAATTLCPTVGTNCTVCSCKFTCLC
jgi:hypothetical protein